MVSVYLLVIAFLCLLNEVILRDFMVQLKKWGIGLSVFITIMIITISFFHIMIWKDEVFSSSYPYSYQDFFYGGIIKKDVYEHINKVTNFIRQNDNQVIVLSERAALYMVPLKQSHGIFDLAFLGNMGKNGEEGAIKEISEMKNMKILIVKDENLLNKQESKKLYYYIKDHYYYEGDIEDFLIYEIKENNP